MKAIVNITLKHGVLDPRGKAVEKALGSLGYSDINSVRMGTQIVIDLNCEDREKNLLNVKKMCEDLLANPVIEDYEIII